MAIFQQQSHVRIASRPQDSTGLHIDWRLERADNRLPYRGPTMKQSPRPRGTAKLSDSVLHQLNMYALGATAAGVGVFALAQCAEGKIVYTPAHKAVLINHALPLDLNHDGIDDFDVFNLTHNSTTPFGDYLKAEPLRSGNEIWVAKTSRGFSNYAAALPAGFRVGANKTKFQAGRNLMAFWSLRASGTVSGGPWKNVRNRYLGLKFLITGKVHYGWARLKVSIANQEVNATLTGYAYETIPNKPIITGNTKSEATLGRLAAGR
jgi:hypothetical protein